MRGQKRLTLHLLQLSISIGLVVVWGCGEQEMAGRPSGPDGVLLATKEFSGQMSILREVTCRETVVVGNRTTVVLKLHGHRLVIPKKALPEGVVVTVRVSLTEPRVLMLDLEPDSLTFVHGHPAELSFSYEDAELGDTPAGKLAIYRYVGGGRWECLGGRVNYRSEEVTVELEHFSRYALASR